MSESETPAPDLIGAARAESDAPGVELSNAAPGEGEGDLIGGYKLLQSIGEGGMGSVWMAQQSAPIQRKVALKIVKLGMDTKEVVARFEAERQALAMMDHPHIAKVLDGGATDHGRPFFVMELVRGTPITDYCDKAKLGLRERLALFMQVCGAVQHAHHKGIIHRDIKPSNVMVSLYDGVAVPKVIDFGIAKATSGELTRNTLFTRYEQMIGTPEYMAPEQAELSGLDIDTRADVYSLGVLLYELLTGTLPFDIKAALQVGYDELLRTIREVDPATPSTRVSTLGDEASPIAAKRHVEAGSLAKNLRGDLDWIVMKALEKDRARRYETANGFAMDIERYLNQEPVIAAPPSAMYRMRKFVQRRKRTVVAIGAIVILVIAGSVGTGVGWWRTQKANEGLDVALGEKSAALGRETLERERAEQNEVRALRAEAEAKAEALRAAAAEKEASQRADERDQIATFQAERLAQIDAEMMGVRLRRSLLAAGGDDRHASLTKNLAGLNFTSISLKVLEQNLFAETIASIDRQFEGQPLVQAQLLITIGVVLRKLGLLDLAMDPTQRALGIRREKLGDDHPDTLGAIGHIGVLLESQGKLDEAEPFHREALEGNRRVQGDDHPHTLGSINNMGALLSGQGELAEAEPFFREALKGHRRVLGDDHRRTLSSINNLGFLLQSQGKLAEAEPFFREALEGKRRVLGNDHPDTLIAIGNMGYLLQGQGKLAEAEPYLREALEGSRRVLGDDHPDTLRAIGNMGSLLQSQGKLAEAEPFYREALEGRRRVLGDDHPDTLIAIGNMGFLLWNQGKLDEAEPFYRETLEGSRRVLGNDHPDTLRAIGNMGYLLQGQGKLAEAEPFYRETLERSRRVLGNDHPDTLIAIGNMGGLLSDQGKLAEAEPFYREALEDQRRVLGDDHPDTLIAIGKTGILLRRQGKLDEAEHFLREALEGQRRVLWDDHPNTLRSIQELGTVLVRLIPDERAGDTSDFLGSHLADLGELLLLQGEFEQAEEQLSEGFELLAEQVGGTHWRASAALSGMGAAMAGQSRHAEAEALLLESAETLMANDSLAKGQRYMGVELVPTAIQRVVNSYVAWQAAAPNEGHDEQAAEWRARLAQWKHEQGQ